MRSGTIKKFTILYMRDLTLKDLKVFSVTLRTRGVSLTPC